MKMENFEETLAQMSKPEVTQLKHLDMLANSITKAKDKSALSWWWLSIPLYMIAALFMKTLFMPQTTLISNLHNVENRTLFLLVLPLVFIALNIKSIHNIYFLSGSPKTINFLKTVWFNVLIILCCIFILFIYLL